MRQVARTRGWRPSTGGRPRHPTAPRPAIPEGEFSIGEAAALVGVSTHVIRSWERRLTINLSRRTLTNQRRFALDDVQRMIAIRRLHVSAGLPLAEAAERALTEPVERPDAESADVSSQALGPFWAALTEAIPDLLIVVDRSGKIVALNSAVRALVNARRGQQLAQLAPRGWQGAYEELYKTASPGRQPRRLPLAGRAGVVWVDVLVAPATHHPFGEMVIYAHVGRDAPHAA